jgi:hypothetical protein
MPLRKAKFPHTRAVMRPQSYLEVNPCLVANYWNLWIERPHML